MKLPNFLKGFSIKSVAHHDQFYVDDEGKHVIFRTIRGKIVPIKTTAEEYAEWLLKQGVNIDPADQKQLHSLEEELEVLERAAEISPELQKKYEQAFSQQKQQYAQMVTQMYQRAVEAQSKESGIPAERIRETRQKTFEESKGRTVKRKDMPDRGWESFTESYVDKMIESAGFEKKSGQWYIMQAYDLMLKKAKDAAQSGIDPTTIDLDKMVEEELKTYSALTRHSDHYAQYKDNATDYSVEANMFKAVKWLKENLGQENESSAFMKDAFDAIYSKMHEDFNPQAKEEFETLPESVRVPQEMIPKELPRSYGARESAALMGVYRNSKGSKLGAAHTVSLHTIARLYDSIPEDERVASIAELSDSSRGVHAIHQSKYRAVYHDKEQFGVEVNVERELEEILRAATRGSGGTTRDKVQAIKEISGKLGLIHGAHTLAAMGDNPSMIKYRNKWQDASLNAGKRKGDGPNIIDTLIDPSRLESAMLTNATLKVPHTPLNTKTPSPTIDIPETVAKKPDRAKKVPQPSEPSFTKEGKSFVTADGYKVTPGKGQWSVSGPDGEEVGGVFIEPGKPGDQLVKALREAEAVIDKHRTGGKEEAVVAPSAMFGFSKQPLSNKDRASLDKLSEAIKSNGMGVKEKIPGVLYEVPGTGLSVGYRKSSGTLLFHGPDRKPIGSIDEAISMLSTSQETVVETSPQAVETPVEKPGVDLLSIAKEKGGFTYSVTEGKIHEPDSGYAVSMLSKEEGEAKISTQEDIDAFQEKHKDLLAKPNTYMGAWVNDAGDLVADVSTTYESEEEANSESLRNGQDGFYDFKSGKTIYTNQSEDTTVAEEPSVPSPEETAKFSEEIAAREDLPREVRETASSGRYNFSLTEKDEDGRESFTYGLKGTESWPSVSTKVKLPDGSIREKKPVKYNPEIAEAVEKEDEYGTTYEYNLKPGWSKSVEHNDPNMMYRGMSWEEWEEAQKTGHIQSKGGMNIGEQQDGLTYFSDNTGEASHYASSFAPERYRATPEKPAILIAVPKREGKQVGGTGRSEIGIEGQIPLSEVSRTWEGHPYFSGEDGNISVRQDWGAEGKSLGSSSSITSSVAWKEPGSPAKSGTPTSEKQESTATEYAPQEQSPEEPVVPVEEKSPTLEVDFAGEVKDQSQLAAISKYANKSGLKIKQPKPGRKDFEVVADSGASMTIAMNKAGALFMMKPGQKAEPFVEKEFIRHFNPDDAFETVKMDKSRKTEAISDKPMKAKAEKAPKKNVDFDRKKKGIPWDSAKYGEVGARGDGTPTQGFAIWVLENLGYRPDGFGTTEVKDDKGNVTSKKDPNQPIYSQEMLSQVIRKYKGLAPKGAIQSGETMKSIGLDSGRNVLPEFFFRRKS